MAADDPPFSLKGSLLLASPMLCDGIFDRSVILIVEHSDKDGSLGFILNRKQTDKQFGEVVSSSHFPRELHKLPLHCGGPVAPDQYVFAAFSRRNNQLQYKTNISSEEAAELTRVSGTIVRVFAGHSGWVPSQLEQELATCTWINAAAAGQLLDFEHDQSLWKNILRQISPYHAILAEASKKPFLN